jgi:non-specific serine/threonine protein kinase
LRAKVLLTAGSIGNNVPEAETRVFLEAALGLSRESGDRATEAVALNNLARVLDWHLELPRARALLEEARRINRELGNKIPELHNMSNLVNVLREQHELAAAQALADEGLAASRSVGDRWLEAIFLYLLGRVALDGGHTAAARKFNEQALGIFRELAMPDWQSFSLVKLAFLAIARGDPAAARRHLAEAVDISRRFGGRLNLAECIGAMGVLASDIGQHRQAARLWGVADGLLGSLFSTDILDRELVAPYDGKSRAALGDAAYAAARKEGRTLPRETAVDQAIAWLTAKA